MRRLIFMIMEIKRNIADNHVSAYAAQAAYFIMLSLIPLLILLLSMIQFTGIGKADFYSLIQHLVPQGFHVQSYSGNGIIVSSCDNLVRRKELYGTEPWI